MLNEILDFNKSRIFITFEPWILNRLTYNRQHQTVVTIIHRYNYCTMDFNQIAIEDNTINQETSVLIWLELVNARYKEVWSMNYKSTCVATLFLTGAGVIQMNTEINRLHLIASDDKLTNIVLGSPEPLYVSAPIAYLPSGDIIGYEVIIPKWADLSFSYIDNMCRVLYYFRHITELSSTDVYKPVLNIEPNIKFLAKDNLLDITEKVASSNSGHFAGVYLTYSTTMPIFKYMTLYGLLDIQDEEIAKFQRSLVSMTATVHEVFRVIKKNLKHHKAG